MRVTLEELREIVSEAIGLAELHDYVPASKPGTRAMKEFAHLFGDEGYSFVSFFHDSVDGVTWPVVAKDSDKHVFEYDGSMFVRDGNGWLELDYRDLTNALKRYAINVFRKGAGKSAAKHRFWDDVRYASIG